MKLVRKETLKKMIEEKDDFELINVLGPESFEAKHIPGSINIPIDERFEENMTKKVADKKRKIVVYCASKECHASEKAAEKLDELGYKNVLKYEGGVKEWEESGYELDGEMT